MVPCLSFLVVLFYYLAHTLARTAYLFGHLGLCEALADHLAHAIHSGIITDKALALASPGYALAFEAAKNEVC